MALKRLISISLVLFIVGGLVTMEIGLRHKYQIEHDRLSAEWQGTRKELSCQADKDPALVYSYKPNKFGANSRGYYDYEYSYKKNKDTFRVVTIGDSIAEGEGVGFKDNFSKVLEKKLNDNAKGRKYEVIVLARSGYSTSQELVLLKKEALGYEPDLIIWSYALNDPAHPVFDNANGQLGKYFYKPKIYLLYYFTKKFFYFVERIKSMGCPKEYHEFLHCVHRDEVAADIREIGKISKMNNIPIIFLIHPVFQQGKTFAEYSLFELHHKLADLAASQNLIALDVLDVYKGYKPDDVKFHTDIWYDCWHPGKRGHNLIADSLYNLIVSRGY